jgi:hypothetical protein
MTVFKEFLHLLYLQPQKSNHSLVFFFGAYGKLHCHNDATNGEKPLHGEGQIHHYNSEVPCFGLHVYLAGGQS